jgi:hypothetical protein
MHEESLQGPTNGRHDQHSGMSFEELIHRLPDSGLTIALDLIAPRLDPELAQCFCMRLPSACVAEKEKANQTRITA